MAKSVLPEGFTMNPRWLPGVRKTITTAFRNPDAVIKLGLTNLFGDEIPDIFDAFPHLESLSIGSNNATSLPPSIASCTALRSVWLGECSALQSLDPLWGLPKLESVTASHCQSVATIGDAIASSQELVNLSLALTHLVTLPEAIAALPKLTRISLQIHFKLDLTALWPVLAACPALEIIDMKGSRLTSWPAQLPRPPKLKILHVGSYNQRPAELPPGMATRLREALEGVQVFDGAEHVAPWKFVPSATPKAKTKSQPTASSSKRKPASRRRPS